MRPDDGGFADILNGLPLGGTRRRGRPPAEQVGPDRPRPEPAVEPQAEEPADIVRAYAWTAGRTHPDAHLELETLVSAAQAPVHPLPAEHHTVVEICRHTRSVAEVAASLSLPLGVVKVLVGDLASRGLLLVHRTDSAPDLSLMARVLTGLRNL